MVSLVLMLSIAGWGDIDRVSSGRLGIWTKYIEAMGDEGIAAVFFGASESPKLTDEVQSYSRLQDLQEDHSRGARIDNVYLQVWFEGGVVGMALFVGYFFWLFAASRKLPLDRKLLWDATVISVLVQGFFISNMLAFYAPVALFMVLALGLPAHFEKSMLLPTANR